MKTFRMTKNTEKLAERVLVGEGAGVKVKAVGLNAHQVGRALADIDRGYVTLIEKGEGVARLGYHGLVINAKTAAWESQEGRVTRVLRDAGLKRYPRLDVRMEVRKPDGSCTPFTNPHPAIRSLTNYVKLYGGDPACVISKHIACAILLAGGNLVIEGGDEKLVAEQIELGFQDERRWLAANWKLS